MEPQDELDKMLFDYFEKTRDDIPVSTQNIIKNAFREKHEHRFSIIKKAAIVILSLVVAGSGVVLAVNIVNHIKNNYVISTNGIDAAIENGEGQNINMDFVYDKGIGIKVNNILLDETNLNIEYEYDYKDEYNISNIMIDEYLIRDQDNNIIYFYSNDENKVIPHKKIANNRFRNSYKENKQYKENILYTSEQFPKISTLYFEIMKISINNKKISGMWLFDIDIDKKEKSSKTYIATYSQYIDKINIRLDKTILNIELEVNEAINSDMIIDPNNVILTDYKNKKYDYISMEDGKVENKNIISLKYDISSYDYEKIGDLSLYICFNVGKKIDIKLKRV